jgi:hypothetical protein
MFRTCECKGTGTDPLILFRQSRRLKPRPMVDEVPAMRLLFHAPHGAMCIVIPDFRFRRDSRRSKLREKQRLAWVETLGIQDMR